MAELMAVVSHAGRLKRVEQSAKTTRIDLDATILFFFDSIKTGIKP